MARKVYYTKKGQPYIKTKKGKAKFISKKSASRRKYHRVTNKRLRKILKRSFKPKRRAKPKRRSSTMARRRYKRKRSRGRSYGAKIDYIALALAGALGGVINAVAMRFLGNFGSMIVTGAELLGYYYGYKKLRNRHLKNMCFYLLISNGVEMASSVLGGFMGSFSSAIAAPASSNGGGW
jgi:hypothetical protein